MATRHAIYGRPGATYLDVPDDIITGKCDVDKVVQVERAPDPPRMVAPMKNIEAALNLLQRAERPLVLIGKGMTWSRAENEVRAFIERTQLLFLRSPKGVMPDDHPLSVAERSDYVSDQHGNIPGTAAEIEHQHAGANASISQQLLSQWAQDGGCLKDKPPYLRRQMSEDI
jgi:thiamine pyrophosphate-dependent acetolactate synthase large subunit-like protein